MRVEQSSWTASGGWSIAPGEVADAQLVLVFASRALLSSARLEEISHAYPSAHVVGCSTAGEIRGTLVTDDSLVVTAVHFEKTRIRHATTCLDEHQGKSAAAGRHLAEALSGPDLVHVFVLSEGLKVNGSELVTGLTTNLPDDVTVTGGLSGDGADFAHTLVAAGHETREGMIAAVGFYGDAIRIGYASLGGWDQFGPERAVTRADGNVLYELDGKSALDLYKEYLGEHAAGLPATGLLFPLEVRAGESDTPVVRTLLAIDEAANSMTFAGDIPEHGYARLMRANIDRLVEGAAGAATNSISGLPESPALAVLISCVGRKMVLKQRVEEEVEAVREVLGPSATLTGFYSYGEISPFTPNACCELHNQTMTVTTLAEV